MELGRQLIMLIFVIAFGCFVSVNWCLIFYADTCAVSYLECTHSWLLMKTLLLT